MRTILSITTLVILLAAACDRPTALQPGEEVLSSQNPVPGAPQAEWLRAVKQATARFNSTTQALQAGYEPPDHCVEVPGLGGMGYHWINGSLIDPDFDPRQPEVVLYREGRGGQLELVAIEYIVIDVGQERPTFAGYPFDIGGVPPLMDAGIPHWSLHVWLYEENPNGIFTPFNPVITCPADPHAH